MKTVFTDNAPKVVGPYSQAIVANGFIFCAGQIGLDPGTGELVEGVEEQTKQVMKNITAVLTAAGTNKENIVKTTIYLKNMSDYPLVNEIYGGELEKTLPARSTVAVAALPKDALVEIEVIATVSVV